MYPHASLFFFLAAIFPYFDAVFYPIAANNDENEQKTPLLEAFLYLFDSMQ